MIIEFTRKDDAQLFLNKINVQIAAQLREQGYEVVEKNGTFEAVGKNAMTGRSDPSATRTLSWDEVHESPDGTFYVAAGDGKILSAYLTFLEDLPGIIRDCPPEWTKFPRPQGFLATLRTFSKRLFGVAEV